VRIGFSGFAYSSLHYLTWFVALIRLTGTIPESFGQLKNLAALELGHNNLEGTLPDVWDNGFLRYFSVVNNSRLGGLLPASLFNPNMGLLRIPYCNFTGPLPVYQRLTNLNDFSAEFNRLNGSLQSLFENLDESIAQIRLHQNQFSGLVPKVTKEQRIGWKNLRTLVCTQQHVFLSRSNTHHLPQIQYTVDVLQPIVRRIQLN
jgi:hypothetical protein